MATVKHFHGETELTHPHGMPNAEFVAKFGQINGKRFDSFSRLVGYVPGTRNALPVKRSITYKSNPSKHVCDARCMNASGKTMNCECSCGGKNHGRGSFNCSAT